MSKILTIDFDTLPIIRRDELLRLIKDNAGNNRRRIENDVQTFSDGIAKEDMLKWADALRKIEDDASKIYAEYNYTKK